MDEEIGQVTFYTPLSCNGGACIEVGFGASTVYVRKRGRKELEAAVPIARWLKLVAESRQAGGIANLASWFSVAAFTGEEVMAFASDILSPESRLAAPQTA
jgi:hypothetical protein